MKSTFLVLTIKISIVLFFFACIAPGKLSSQAVENSTKDLALTANGELPVIKGKPVKPGNLQLLPHSITFLTIKSIGEPKEFLKDDH